MSDLIGLLSIIFVFFITYFLTLKQPTISKILFVGLIFRVLILLLGQYVFILPGSSADAVTYERIAWELAQNNLIDLLNKYPGPDSRFISWLIALPYYFFGRSLLLAKSISLLVSILSIYFSFKLAKKIWKDDYIAKKITWVIVFFPSLILYSVIVMREVYIYFFLVVSLYGVVSWVETKKFSSVLLAFLGFTGSTFFHGAMITGGITFFLIVLLSSFRDLLKLISKFKISLKVLLFLAISISILTFLVFSKYQIPYLGDFDKLTELENLLRKGKYSTMGDASYPSWTVPNSFLELFYKIPIRSFYFLFAPFPWDITKTQHLIGMFDGLLYFYLIFLIFKNRKTIWNSNSLKIILMILISYIIVFSLGVGNFGTSFRHRSKFVILIIMLSGPLLKKIVIRNK